MLRALSGRRHRVITGLAFYRKAEDRLLTGYDLTYVTFRELSDGMIEGYLAEGTFHDKAGAYAVQEVGDAFVARMKGDYDNVVGFPVEKVRRLLARFTAPALTVEVEDIDFPSSDGKAETGGRKLLIPGAVPGEKLRVQVVGERGAAQVAETIRVEPRRRGGPRRGAGISGRAAAAAISTSSTGPSSSSRSASSGACSTKAGCRRPRPPSGPSPPRRTSTASGTRWSSPSGRSTERSRSACGRGSRRAARPTAGRCRSRNARSSARPSSRVFPVFLDFAAAHGLEGFEPATRKGHLRHLVLREGKRTGELMALLVTAELPEVDLDALAGRLAAAAPELRSFVHVTNSRGSDLVEFERTALVAGVPFIEEKLAGLSFRIYPPSFFQTNTAGAELLYRRLGDEAGLTKASRVLGLYCGSGAIELTLAANGGDR